MANFFGRYNGIFGGGGGGGGGVTSLNTETGDLTLVSADASVTITAPTSTTINLAVNSAAPTSIGAVDSQAKNANALALASHVLSTQLFDSTHPGVVPSSGGGTTTFLRADGTFAIPPGTAAPGGSNMQLQYNNSGVFGGASPTAWDSAASSLYIGGDNSGAEAGSLNVIAKSDGIFAGLNLISFDRAVKAGIILRSSGDFFLYSNNNVALNAHGVFAGTGPSDAISKWDVNNADTTTNVATPILFGATCTTTNHDTSPGVFGTFGYVNQLGVMTSYISGVHTLNAANDTGNMYFMLQNAGTKGEAFHITPALLDVKSGLTVQFEKYGAGISQFSSTGVISSTAPGTSGNILTSNGTAWTSAAPATSGTVTSVSVVSTNGFAGTVATATSTPAITLTTTITGILKGNGTAISSASSGTDYQAPISTSAAVSNQYVTGFTAPNTFTRAQPTFTNMSDQLINSQITNATIDLTTKVTGILPAANVGLVRTINSQSGTTYTTVLSDGSAAGGNTLVQFTSASAVTVTIPTNASVAYPIGTQIDCTQEGAGKVTFAAAGGVTINSAGSKLSIGAQYVGISLVKTATNVWTLYGNLIA